MKSQPPCSQLPDKLSWRFDQILSAEPHRAAALEMAGPPTALVNAIRTALENALASGDVRWGREQVSSGAVDYRAVVQFPVSAELFDWFFNARTGYRAHFRAHHECGLSFNAQIIETLRLSLDARVPQAVVGRQLTHLFQDCGEVQIAKTFLMSSLTPNLSKVWFCTKLIQRGGGIQDLPSGVVGPRILLDDDDSWAAPYRDDREAWLDVKGAFLGERGPYQPKDPEARAKTLQAKGEA